MGAILARLVGVNDRLFPRDRLESRFDFKIELEITVDRGMLAELGIETRLGSSVGADAFQNTPRLLQLLGTASTRSIWYRRENDRPNADG